MSQCDNSWDSDFQLTGSGLTEKDASDDFQSRLEKELKPRIETLKCSEKDCDAENKCLFTYGLDGDNKPKEVEREVTVFNEGKFLSTTMKLWERTCTVKYGCWCFKVGKKIEQK
jgi:hypothetical protein